MEKKRIVEEELKKHQPTTQQAIRAVLNSVELEEQADTPLSSTPEELHNQAGLLLDAKGNTVINRGSGGTLKVRRPGDRNYIILPLGTKVEIGGREVAVGMQEPPHMKPDTGIEPTRDIMVFSLSFGLIVGDDYHHINGAITIGKSEVQAYGDNLIAPDDIRRVSTILQKVDRVLPPTS